MNVSRDTVYKWRRRAKIDADGQWWLDRSSRPHRSPARTPRKLERKILSLRRNKKLGPARIAGRLELPASTVHAVLVRNDMSRLASMDRPTGEVIRRYRTTILATWSTRHQQARHGPTGGGWRVHGRAAVAGTQAKKENPEWPPAVPFSPHRPQTHRKVERFNRTPLDE